MCCNPANGRVDFVEWSAYKIQLHGIEWIVSLSADWDQSPKKKKKKKKKRVFLVHHYYNNQNIKSVFLVHHYYDNQNIEKNIEIYFWCSDFTYGIKKDQDMENWKHQLPMAYYLWSPRPVGG